MKKQTIGLVAACLLGMLPAAAVTAGLRAQAHAEGAAISPSGFLDVVINEVAWMGTTADYSDEWIELYNTTGQEIDLGGWSLAAADGTPNILLSGIIPAQGYFLLERTSDDTVRDIPADLLYTGALGNNPGAERLILYDAAVQIVDTANGDGSAWPAGDNTAKRTMERSDPAAADTDDNWCTNDGLTRNGLDAEEHPINGTPGARNSCTQPPAQQIPDLTIEKTGPSAAAPGSLITYHITLGNVGTFTAAGVRVADTLPDAVDLIAQSSLFTFTQAGGVLTWDVGSVAAAMQVTMTLTGRLSDGTHALLTNVVTVTIAAGEAVTTNNTACWTTRVGSPAVLISAVLFDGYQADDTDEAVQLSNVGTAAVNLQGWSLCKDTGSGLGCRPLPSATLSPTHHLWLARDDAGFTASFGFPPHQELDPWLPYGLSNSGDEVVLQDEAGHVVDALVYRNGLTTTAGWNGPGVAPLQIGSRTLEGQILYRIPQENTGLPAADTDTASDWAQSTQDSARARRVLYPGWDLDPLFYPLSAVETATVIVGIAPDNGFDVISQTIARAQHTISAELYSLTHPEVITALVQKAREGISITILLEGQPAFDSRESPDWQQELWACQQIEAAGGECWFMVRDSDARIFDRYSYLHAKLLIVDGAWLALGSQNLTASSLPSDDKSNGTYGSRGVVLATNAPSPVARAAQLFALDLDPLHHNDLLRWSPGLTGTYGPPLAGFTPQLTVPDTASTTLYFPTPLVISDTIGFELFTAPEAALRQSDALLGLVARAGAGDTVYVEQLDEPVAWGQEASSDPNPRLDATIAAARRGATVRILLNGGTFGGPAFYNENLDTVAYVNRIAHAEGLDLRAASGDPTHYGIHNKMVLVWLHDEGGYAHVGSINGSEGSNKINREIAIQVHSDEIAAYLTEMFELDWRWAQPIYLPLVMRRYTPPADHLLISEVMVQSSCEWVEIYNPTPRTLTLSGHKIGDAESPDRYEGMYVFPVRELGPGELILVAGDAAPCEAVSVDYQMVGSAPGIPTLSRDPNWGVPGWEFGLSNSGDEVLLLDPANRPIDVVTYGSGSYPGVLPHPLVSGGETIERIPADTDTDDCRFDFRPGWSPGSARFNDP